MIRTVLTAAAAVLALAGCTSTAPTAAPAAPTRPAIIHLELPAIPPADVPDTAPGCGNACGTDAGLVGPAPRVQDLEAQERPAGSVPAVVVEETVAEQLPEESGGRAIDCEDGTVAEQSTDGVLVCGTVNQ